MANQYLKLFVILVFLGLIIGIPGFMGQSLAAEMRYFGSEIDYWHAPIEPIGKGVAPVQKRNSEQGDAVKADPQKFQWKNYLDPKNTEFFKEGDYTPPEPFMELVRNPSDGNIRMWFAYLEKKNLLSDRLAQRMEEYAKKYRGPAQKEVKGKFAETVQNIPTPSDDFQRFRFRMYFDSQCPHCQKMFATLNDLQDRGYFVEARQIDSGGLDRSLIHVPVVQAKADEIGRFKVKSVPLLLIGDMREKKVYRKSGYLTPTEIMELIRDQ